MVNFSRKNIPDNGENNTDNLARLSFWSNVSKTDCSCYWTNKEKSIIFHRDWKVDFSEYLCIYTNIYVYTLKLFRPETNVHLFPCKQLVIIFV